MLGNGTIATSEMRKLRPMWPEIDSASARSIGLSDGEAARSTVYIHYVP